MLNRIFFILTVSLFDSLSTTQQIVIFVLLLYDWYYQALEQLIISWFKKRDKSWKTGNSKGFRRRQPISSTV